MQRKTQAVHLVRRSLRSRRDGRFYITLTPSMIVIRYVLVVGGRSAESLDERIRAWPKGYDCAWRAL